MNWRRRATLFGVVLLVLTLGVAGCGQSDNDNTNGDDEPQTVSIMIGGSDSEVNVVTRIAEEYMNANSHVSIAITGGGSGVGISSLIDGDIDIANSSRPMRDSEIEQVKTNRGEDVYAVRFAVDGVAVIVNEENPVSELTVDQIGAIYRGDITNWSDVGGEDRAITLFGRQSTSGTYVFFMELVVQGEYSPTKRNLGGNADIVEAVRTDAGGIGYVAIGYAMEGDKTAPGLKALEVAADDNSPAYTPIVLENVTSGDYPLTRPLYQFVAGKPEGAMLDFFLYEVSEAGQQLVLDEGFYPITAADREFNKRALE